jgi:glycerol-3-phosphate dehydrogenase (NAD(P)+)
MSLAGNRRLAVLGAGSWGTALAIALASRFEAVALWARDPDRARELDRLRENSRYLPGFHLPKQVTVSNDLTKTLADADTIVSVVPSGYLRGVLEATAPHISPRTPVVSATKGFEEESLCRMSQVVQEAIPGSPVAVLSGPTFAKEIAAGEPAAVVIASEDIGLAEGLQQSFATPALRFYTSRDIAGVEVGAAMKNVIALGAGICRGLGLGSNSVAALVTRGLAESTRLAAAMGGDPRTLSGLAGLGDLVLTATGDLSRNRSVGIELGRGRKLDEILAQTTMVAEGITTCRAARQLGLRHNVDLPIAGKMYEVLYEGKEVRAAIRDLMERPLTSE